jgi:hypothetical protein
MGMSFKKSYYYLYYKIYRLCISISDDFLNDFKPIVFITLMEVFLLFTFLICFEIISGIVIRYNIPYLFGIPVASILVLSNYIIFLHKDKWKNYIDEFAEYDKKNKWKGGLIVALISGVIFITLILSIYWLSRIGFKTK